MRKKRFAHVTSNMRHVINKIISFPPEQITFYAKFKQILYIWVINYTEFNKFIVSTTMLFIKFLKNNVLYSVMSCRVRHQYQYLDHVISIPISLSFSFLTSPKRTTRERNSHQLMHLYGAWYSALLILEEIKGPTYN
jgi:hypothetical protein